MKLAFLSISKVNRFVPISMYSIEMSFAIKY
jgi:hypothetical protein